MKLGLILSLVFVFCFCKKQNDTTCRSRTETANQVEGYTERDTTSGLAGQQTLSFSLKSNKRVIDGGVCDFGNAPECTNECTLTNLTNKNVVLTYAPNYTQSLLAKSSITLFIGNEALICGLTLATVKNKLTVKYQ